MVLFSSEGTAMTEMEWMTCQEPQELLAFLCESRKASDRKLRLFACACCRHVWQLLTDKRAQTALEMAEQVADQLVDDDQRSKARKEAQQCAQTRAVTSRPTSPKCERRAASAVYYALGRQGWDLAWNAGQLACEALVWQAGGYWTYDAETAARSETAVQVHLLHDLFGSPFHSSPIDPAWLTPTVLGLAQAVYDERILPSGALGTARLGVLGDALEDAGCTEQAILTHLREPGPHTRGCWPVDLLLGKG